ncbi:putative phosphohydrolase [Gloeomargarita lithophora Alchichica-D10]|uniref:Putative phosphohydrolase n=1 Tax=Gloeomargarita lithophora Alchichica-D10 TaxID=1188229 RepID=A0A1J0AH69_9CYAN|nr:metallophosphoesterase [Gloeomargarita lithophora]APB35290.1 putative phosphohydrolase [Gloeomargarita lithophora Alchichica-D10]
MPALVCRFAVLSDPHITTPETHRHYPHRLHRLEYSIPILETTLERLAQQSLDFLLIPGDLTQHGEPANHAWLAHRLSQLPFPSYVIPGNHDIPPDPGAIAAAEFPRYYRQQGYRHTDELYYAQEIAPGVGLIGLNSNQFDAQGNLIGRIDAQQWQWLETVLEAQFWPHTLVMVHHNICEHLPNQSRSILGQRYLLENRLELQQLLKKHGIHLVFTGHLHVQDIAEEDDFFDVTTGSLVSYPHAYRLLTWQDNRLHITTERVTALAAVPNLLQEARLWMEQRSPQFIVHLLTHPPLNLPVEEAQALAPRLGHFWPDIAWGDAHFFLPDLPSPVREFFEACSDRSPGDNQAVLPLPTRKLWPQPASV